MSGRSDRRRIHCHGFGTKLAESALLGAKRESGVRPVGSVAALPWR
jgi:hypothetical protein